MRIPATTACEVWMGGDVTSAVSKQPLSVCFSCFYAHKLVSAVHCDALVLKGKQIKSHYKQTTQVHREQIAESGLFPTDENTWVVWETRRQIEQAGGGQLITADWTGTACPFALSSLCQWQSWIGSPQFLDTTFFRLPNYSCQITIGHYSYIYIQGLI